MYKTMVSGNSRTLLSASWRSLLSRRCLVSSSSSSSYRSYYHISSNNSTSTIRQSSYRLRVSPSSLSSLQQHNLASSQCRWFSSYPPHEVVGLPSLSPTMESGSIASWNKNEGDEFVAGDVLCEVETDKATVDFEAQDDGYIAKIFVPAGAGEISCGDPIMITVENEEDIAAFSDYTPAPAADAAPPAPAAPPTPAPPTPPAAAAPSLPPPTPAPAAPTGGRIVASPLAFQKAKEMGYDISQIIGTGPGGRVIAADVVEYTPAAATVAAAAPSPTTPVPPPAAAPSLPPPTPIAGADYTDYPLSPSSLSLAASLAHAKQSIPHYYLTIDLSLDKMLALRSSLSGEVDVSLQSFLIKAAAKAMTSVPSVNASWMETFVRQYDNVDINVVMRNEGGSFQPCLPSVQSMGIAKIDETLGGLLDDATVPAENDKMGTFTIFNGGMYGMASSAMIIRQPQACALSLGVAEKRLVPGEEEGSVEESVMLTATLSCDHRVVDGAVGAQWLQAFKTCVEHPETLLL